ncbi:MAG TPA: helix-hairpin-helix domain-containing protein [Acidisarcina sp.]|nr:helix-hairpin-helix domain-containing protein [Acidisarcina sp.]
MKRLRAKHLRILQAGALLLPLVFGIGACQEKPKTAEQQDREIQQKSAEATVKIKEGAQEAASKTKEATADAQRKLNAVAAGVKEGLQTNPDRLDLNTATVEKVASLPGISKAKAEQIVKARPYESTHDLVVRGILTESQYERISSQITAR